MSEFMKNCLKEGYLLVLASHRDKENSVQKSTSFKVCRPYLRLLTPGVAGEDAAVAKHLAKVCTFFVISVECRYDLDGQVRY